MSSAAAIHPLVADLRQAIENRNLTQEEAADQLGVGLRTLAAWLSGEIQTPRPKQRRTIIAWLESEEQAA